MPRPLALVLVATCWTFAVVIGEPGRACGTTVLVPSGYL